MPDAAPHACNAPGCPNRAPMGKPRCAACTTAYEAKRGTASARGYGSRWQKYRARFLKAHPLCAQCLTEGRTTPATVVDHITAHKGDETLFWDPRNHRAACKPHHDARTDEGDFGRAPTPRK